MEFDTFHSAIAFSKIRDKQASKEDTKVILRRFLYGSFLAPQFKEQAVQLCTLAMSIGYEVHEGKRRPSETDLSLFSDTLRLVEEMEKMSTLSYRLKAEEKTINVYL